MIGHVVLGVEVLGRLVLKLAKCVVMATHPRRKAICIPISVTGPGCRQPDVAHRGGESRGQEAEETGDAWQR